MLQKHFSPGNLSWHEGPELSQADPVSKRKTFSNLVSLEPEAGSQRKEQLATLSHLFTARLYLCGCQDGCLQQPQEGGPLGVCFMD